MIITDWIDNKVARPAENGRYLTVSGTDVNVTTYNCNVGWKTDHDPDVSYWAPLPELPYKVKNYD